MQAPIRVRIGSKLLSKNSPIDRSRFQPRIAALTICGYSRNKFIVLVPVDWRVVYRVDAWFQWNARWNRLCRICVARKATVTKEKRKKSKKILNKCGWYSLHSIYSVQCSVGFRALSCRRVPRPQGKLLTRWKSAWTLRELTKLKINEKEKKT